MSNKMASESLREVTVEHKRRHTRGPTEIQVFRTAKLSSMSQPDFSRTQDGNLRSDFVYVNQAFVGSVNNINENRLRQDPTRCQPPTSVVREQYWACSKWPFGQRILAIAVGLLLGTVIGLTILVVLRGMDKDIIPDFLTRPAMPD